MGLRTKVNEQLPDTIESPRLSTATARSVFRGSYFWKHKILGIEPAPNSEKPFSLLIHRERPKGKQGSYFVHGATTQTDYDVAIKEIADPQAIARINRVEGVARTIKLLAAPFAISLTFAAISGPPESQHEAVQQPNVPSCQSVNESNNMQFYHLNAAQAASGLAQLGDGAPICKDSTGYSLYGKMLMFIPAPEGDGTEPVAPSTLPPVQKS
jgi:hypothetical protein